MHGRVFNYGNDAIFPRFARLVRESGAQFTARRQIVRLFLFHSRVSTSVGWISQGGAFPSALIFLQLSESAGIMVDFSGKRVFCNFSIDV